MLCSVILAAMVYSAISVSSEITGIDMYQHAHNGAIDDVVDTYDVRPIFRPTPQNVSVDIGQRAILRCRVDNLGAKIITWRRVGDIHPMTIGLFTFVSDSRVSVEYNKRSSEWCLVIHDVRHTDQGLYKCQVNAKEDQYNFYNILLRVKTLQVTGTDMVERGLPIRLVCNATGRPDPPHNVEWYKDSQFIESDVQAGLTITKKIEATALISVLVKQRSKMTDAGDYYCRSSDNDIGLLTVKIINAPVEKRGTSSGKTSSRSAAVVYPNRTNNLVYSIVTLAVALAACLYITGQCT